MDGSLKGMKFGDFKVGQNFVTPARTISEMDIINFAGLSGDYNPLHIDEEFCRQTPFGTRIAHGLLGVIIASGLASRLGIYNGTMVALLSQTINYMKPLKIGDTIVLNINVEEKIETSSLEHGMVVFGAKLVNQEKETVIEGNWRVLVKK